MAPKIEGGWPEDIQKDRDVIAAQARKLRRERDEQRKIENSAIGKGLKLFGIRDAGGHADAKNQEARDRVSQGLSNLDERQQSALEEARQKRETAHVTLENNKIVEQVTIENVRGLRDAFPESRVLESQEIEPEIEAIPSYANMSRVDPNEEVWLTEPSIKDRIELLVHTNPDLSQNEEVSARVYTDAGVSMERNLRKAGNFQDLVTAFQAHGFQFSQDDSGEVVLVVDGRIPAKDNKSGFYKKTGSVNIVGKGAGAVVSKFEPHGFADSGIRPASSVSREIATISVHDLARIHNERSPIEVRYAMPEQASMNMYRTGEQEEREWPFYNHVKNTIRSFSRLIESDSEFGALARRVDGSRGLEFEDRKAAKVELLKLLRGKLGMRASIANHGYFPKEPVFYFAYDGTEDFSREDFLGAEYLKHVHSVPMSSVKHPLPRHFMLEEMLSFFEEGIRWKRNGGE